MHIYLTFLYPSHPTRRRTSLQLAQVRVEVRAMPTKRRRRRSEIQRKKRCVRVLEFKLCICYVPDSEYQLLLLHWQDPNDLPGNKAITHEISQLHEKWQCHSTSCGGFHCYVHPEEKKHLPLGHSHFNLWAATIVSGGKTSRHLPS